MAHGQIIGALDGSSSYAVHDLNTFPYSRAALFRVKFNARLNVEDLTVTGLWEVQSYRPWSRHFAVVVLCYQIAIDGDGDNPGDYLWYNLKRNGGVGVESSVSLSLQNFTCPRQCRHRMKDLERELEEGNVDDLGRGGGQRRRSQRPGNLSKKVQHNQHSPNSRAVSSTLVETLEARKEIRELEMGKENQRTRGRIKRIRELEMGKQLRELERDGESENARASKETRPRGRISRASKEIREREASKEIRELEMGKEIRELEGSKETRSRNEAMRRRARGDEEGNKNPSSSSFNESESED
ncbi:hypothetical protein K474DRAFT_1677529 [Panus rudis PR-1116 ss-1]|nr:hypothetical protein K474DRAFT_1677529 [Panus rudis PR-1116 ss-1]